MKPTGDPEWFEHRAVTPLTGREPLLGRLRRRLSHRDPGWGWVSLRGPAGSGVTRLIDEAEVLAREDGAAFVLRLHPVGTGPTPPMEPLRRALARAFESSRTPQAVERALRACFPEGIDEIGALTSWLVGGEGAVEMARPSPTHVRRFVEHLVRGGPVLVDDIEAMDEATREVLAPSRTGRGFGVIAGTHAAVEDTPGEVWEVEHLSRSQVELLLRRWLKHPATAKRLTNVLLGPCHALPGRLVQAVRELGRQGALKPSTRGITLATPPSTWPDGRRDAAFLRRLAADDAVARRVLDVVSMLGGFEHTELVADAAGVKANVVEAIRREIVAARGEIAPGFFFPTSAERIAHVQRIQKPRAQRIHRRIAEAASRLARQNALRVPHLLAALHAFEAEDGPLDDLATALDLAVRSAPSAYQVQGWVLDLLSRAIDRVASDPRDAWEPIVGRALRLLDQAGRRDDVVGRCERIVATREPRTPSGWWMAARALDASGRRHEALALLERELPSVSGEHDASGAFDGWAQIARWRFEAHDVEAARRAAKRALRHLDPNDLHRRAVWHGGLSVVARERGRFGVAVGHAKRCVGLLRALGYLRPAGAAYLRLGNLEAERGRAAGALDGLARAAHLYQVVSDAEGEAEALFAMGQVHAGCHAYEPATEHLEAALAIVERENLDRLRVPLHLALTGAHRGCGALGRERRHAGEAVQRAAAAVARLRAASALAVADLRSGAPGAERLLQRNEQDLRAAGLVHEADVARAMLAETRLRAGDAEEARLLLDGTNPRVPEVRLTLARLDRGAGDDRRALKALDDLAADPTLPVDLRAAAHIHAAATLLERGRITEARRAATAGAALLEVTHRSRADDARLHGILTHVFARVGETARAAGHRHLSRRGMRRLVQAAADSGEARRLVRMHWQGEARPTLHLSA